MEDRNQELKTTRRRSRRDVFKGPIQGYIHHAGGRGEVVAYNEYVEGKLLLHSRCSIGLTGVHQVRGTSSTRVVHKSGKMTPTQQKRAEASPYYTDTPFRGVERFGGTYENRGVYPLRKFPAPLCLQIV